MICCSNKGTYRTSEVEKAVQAKNEGFFSGLPWIRSRIVTLSEKRRTTMNQKGHQPHGQGSAVLLLEAGERVPSFSTRPLHHGRPAQRLGPVLAVSSDMLDGNKAGTPQLAVTSCSPVRPTATTSTLPFTSSSASKG